jgi:hypothetical protein
MFVLVEDDLGRLMLRRIRPWHRLLASCLASRLDCALASGASPETSVRLAWRAARLTSGRYRRDLATSLWRIAATAGEARTPGVYPLASARPITALLVRSSAARFGEELGDLAESLVAPGPVAVRGVAMVNQLIADGAGPLYRHGGDDELHAVIRRAAKELVDDSVMWSSALPAGTRPVRPVPASTFCPSRAVRGGAGAG